MTERKVMNMWRHRAMIWLMASTTWIGCGVSEEQESADVAPLSLVAAKWPGPVPVCWDPSSTTRSDFATASVTVHDRAFATWSRVAKIDFTGWGTCGSSTGGMVVLHLNSDTAGNSCIGYPGPASSCTVNLGVLRSDFSGSLVPHELGHALGFSHEMARTDFPDDSTGSCTEGNATGDHLDTPPDRQSIMASTGYCQNNPNLSFWDTWGVQNAYGTRVDGVAMLATAWSDARREHATVATTPGRGAVDGSGYTWVYQEGWVFAHQAPQTVPLQLYWHVGHHDNFTTATTDGINAAIAAGYIFVRTEGYVYPTPQPGTVALNLYWSAARQDNLTTANPTAQAAALATGYNFVRTEGYVFSDTPYVLGWRYWNSALGDNVSPAGAGALSHHLPGDGWAFIGTDAAYMVNNLPGTTSADTYFSTVRGDYDTAVRAVDKSAAVSAGYTFVGTEGYLFNDSYSTADLAPFT